jgi:hypothetical protein
VRLRKRSRRWPARDLVRASLGMPTRATQPKRCSFLARLRLALVAAKDGRDSALRAICPLVGRKVAQAVLLGRDLPWLTGLEEYCYANDPAQGFDLVFSVLPLESRVRVMVEVAGRWPTRIRRVVRRRGVFELDVDASLPPEVRDVLVRYGWGQQTSALQDGTIIVAQDAESRYS